MFEQASRFKLRFDSPKGLLSVEDLWDLPLSSKVGKANLDDVARAVHLKLRNDNTISFVEASSKEDPVSQLQLDILKRVIAVRLAENEARANASARKERKQKLLGILERKEDEQLIASSPEEIRAMIESLK